MKNLTFGQAIDLAINEISIKREDSTTTIASLKLKGPFHDEHDNEVSIEELSLCSVTNHHLTPGWTPTQEDMRATDWTVANESDWKKAQQILFPNEQDKKTVEGEQQNPDLQEQRSEQDIIAETISKEVTEFLSSIVAPLRPFVLLGKIDEAIDEAKRTIRSSFCCHVTFDVDTIEVSVDEETQRLIVEVNTQIFCETNPPTRSIKTLTTITAN